MFLHGPHPMVSISAKTDRLWQGWETFPRRDTGGAGPGTTSLPGGSGKLTGSFQENQVKPLFGRKQTWEDGGGGAQEASLAREHGGGDWDLSLDAARLRKQKAEASSQG